MPKQGLIRAYDHQIQIVQRFADAAIIIGVFFFAVWLRGLPWDDRFTIATIASIVFFYLFAKVTNLYQSHRVGGMTEEVKPVIASWSGTVLALILIGYVLKISETFSRVAIGIAVLMVPFALVLWRYAVRRFLVRLRTKGYNIRSVAIIGDGDSARELIMNIRARPWTGLKLLGFVSLEDDRDNGDLELPDGTILGRLGSLDELYKRTRADEVDVIYIAVPFHNRESIDAILRELGDTTVSLYLVPDIYTASIMQGHWITIGTVPTISIIDNPGRGIGSWLKRLEDIVVSLMVLSIMALPMVLIALLIKLSSRGPVFYVQKRYGVNCVPISVIKFRTMTVMDGDGEFSQAKPDDPRVTAFGAFLRRTSLDELPQFFNVLAGTMSVVGPRPHPVALNEQFRGKVDAYTLRHKVKPGITGLAQINWCRGPTTHETAMKARITYDIEYINSWSIWLDMKIILLTPFAMLNGNNAH